MKTNSHPNTLLNSATGHFLLICRKVKSEKYFCVPAPFHKHAECVTARQQRLMRVRPVGRTFLHCADIFGCNLVTNSLLGS